MRLATTAAASEITRRVEAFRSRKADHKSIRLARRAALAACGRSGGENVVIVTGPTGAGKTTLARQLYRDLRALCDEEIAHSPDIIPVLGLAAVPQSGRAFSWKDFYIRLLFQARDPVTNLSLLAPANLDLLGDLSHDTPADRMVADKLRRCAETTLRKRKTRWLVIDEAHHMLLHKDPLVNQIQFEALKSLAIETRTTIVLFGTYKLLDIRDQSGQLVRRSDLIHFQRYDLKDSQHGVHFREALKEFKKHFDLAQKPDLLADWDRYFIKSVGCVGILKDWMNRAYEAFLVAGETGAFDFEHALRFAHPNKALRTIASEAMAGEAKLLDITEDELREFLVPKKADAENGPESNDGTPEQADPSAGTAPDNRSRSVKRHGRVGQRNPKRDPVGAQGYAA
jgi:hypothetical protein